MSTKWITTSEKDLTSVLNSLREECIDGPISFIEAVAVIKDRGAFVEIDSKQTAENLFLPDTVVIYSSRLKESYEECLSGDFCHACFVTGESKTADIEQVLVSGVHGPKECIFVVVQ